MGIRLWRRSARLGFGALLVLVFGTTTCGEGEPTPDGGPADASAHDSSTPDSSGSDGSGSDGSIPDGSIEPPPDDVLTVELLVGTDGALSEQHGDGLECYVEGIVVHVSYIFGLLEPSLHIQVVLARHERDVDLRGLELDSDRNVLLERWIAWSDALNVASDEDPEHFDYAVLLTAQDFGRSGWASTGPAMCHPNTGAIVRDKGYYGAKIVAHEMSHTLGLGHVEGSTFLMNANPGTAWSAESIAALQAIDLGAATCLEDYVAPPEVTGIPSFTLEEQCQTRYGVPACSMTSAQERCDRLVCQTDPSTCSYEVGPRLDGSGCGEGRWCLGGECVDRPAGAVSGYNCAP